MQDRTDNPQGCLSWLQSGLEFFYLVSVASHAVLTAKDFVVLGKEGLVDEDLLADGTLEALRVGMPLLAFVGQPGVLESNGFTACLWIEGQRDCATKLPCIKFHPSNIKSLTI